VLEVCISGKTSLLPLGGMALGDQLMPNRHVWKFIKQLEVIMKVIILDEEHQQCWNQLIGPWSNLMTKA
jgi:hypothetical protein